MMYHYVIVSAPSLAKLQTYINERAEEGYRVVTVQNSYVLMERKVSLTQGEMPGLDQDTADLLDEVDAEEA